MEWIKCSEKLPDLYDFVLVFADNKGSNEPRPIAIARIVNKFMIWELLGTLEVGAYMDIEYDLDKEDITHWMRLPSPPNE